MKRGFEPGIAREIRVKVTDAMCPAFDGRIVHHVYSTWSMVHHMEVAARKVLVDYLDEDEEGIGSHVSADHHSPAVIGTWVTVRAELAEVRHNRAVCRVTAWDGQRLLGEGKQVQVILKKVKLAQLIERSRASG